MANIKKLGPGKRENAFYLESDYDEKKWVSLQCRTKVKMYIYKWDSKKKKMVGQWIPSEYVKS